MHIAYIISAYKLPQQLLRLVSRLASQETSCLIHVDRKSADDVYAQMVAGVQHLPNVHFLSRHVCNHGDFGHVLATLKGIEFLITRGVRFDYAILLTGQDYPIKSAAVVEETLCAADGRSFPANRPIPCDVWTGQGLDRIEAWHFWFRGRHGSFPGEYPFRWRPLARVWGLMSKQFPFRRRFPVGLQPFGGSSYWCLHRDCIRYIRDYVRSHPTFVDYFRHVHIPDEIFFQTIVMNSPFGSSVINSDQRYIDWTRRHGSCPAILDMTDFPAVLQSSALFARKFDPGISAELMDAIDLEVHANHPAPHMSPVVS